MRRYASFFSFALAMGLIVLLSSQPLSAQKKIVTKVVATAKPKAYKGKAPAHIEFIGTIFVSKHPVTVEYEWERSDGAKGGHLKVEVRGPRAVVKDTWDVGASGEHLRIWEKLHVFSPNIGYSTVAVSDVRCKK